MSARPLSPALEALINAFADDAPECENPKAAKGRCAEMSYRFVDLCAEREIACEPVWFEEAPWKKSEVHCVVAVEGVFVDWTYRQFDPAAPVPVIWDAAPWGKVVRNDGSPFA